MPETQGPVEPLEDDAVTQPEEQVVAGEQPSAEGTEPTFEDELAQLVKEKGLEGRWGERKGKELVGAVLESYRNMEQYVGRVQNRYSQQPQQPQPQASQGRQPEQVDSDPLVDQFIRDPKGTIAQVAQEQAQQMVPQMIDQAMANQYVSDHPDIMANAAQVELIMRRNALPFTYQNVRYAHEVFLGKQHDAFSAGQQNFQQGVQQGQTAAQQRQSAQVATGSHRPVPSGGGQEDALAALVKKYGLGNVPQEEMDKLFDQMEGGPVT